LNLNRTLKTFIAHLAYRQRYRGPEDTTNDDLARWQAEPALPTKLLNKYDSLLIKASFFAGQAIVSRQENTAELNKRSSILVKDSVRPTECGD
jgi:hypothetical protein